MAPEVPHAILLIARKTLGTLWEIVTYYDARGLQYLQDPHSYFPKVVPFLQQSLDPVERMLMEYPFTPRTVEGEPIHFEACSFDPVDVELHTAFVFL